MEKDKILFYLETISTFSKLGLSLKEKDKDDCLRTISFFHNQLRKHLLNEEKIEKNYEETINLVGREVIIIMDQSNKTKNYLQDIFERYSINYYIFTEVNEYLDIFDEANKEKLILVSENLVNEFLQESNISENDLLLRVDELDCDINFYINQTEIKFKLLENLINQREFSVKKYRYLNALLIGKDVEELKYASQVLSLMGVEFNIAKDKEKIKYLLGKRAYNIVFLDARYEGKEFEDIIRIIDASISKDTTKVLYGEIKSCAKSIDCYLAALKFWNIDKFLFDYFAIFRGENVDKALTFENKTEYNLTFKNHLSDSIKKMRKELENRNYKKIMQIAHNLKSSSGLLNEIRILSILHEIDDSAVKKNSVKIMQKLEELGENIMK